MERVPRLGSVTAAGRLGVASRTDPAVLLLGTSNRIWANLNLPFDLTGIGAPGCEILAEGLVNLPVDARSGASGFRSWQLVVPAAAALVGADVFAQGVVLDARSNALGAALSNGLHLRAGIR